MSIQEHSHGDNRPLDALRAVSEPASNEVSNYSADCGKAVSLASECARIGTKSIADRVGEAETVGDARRVDGAFSSLGKYIGDLRPISSVGCDSEATSEAGLQGLVNRLARYDRRSIWQKYSSLRAVSCCGYPRKKGMVQALVKNGVWHYRGVERCKSSWVCSVCAAIIRHGRSEEIKRAVLHAMNELGYSVYFVTRTIQHDNGDNLKELIKLQAACKRSVDATGNVKAFYRKFGYLGAITAKEVTHNFTGGFHPHMHQLLFFKKELTDDELLNMQKLLHVSMNRYYEKNGHKKMSAARGIKIEQVNRTGDKLGDYLQKLDGGFNANNEMTRLDLKKARGGSRSAFQIIEDFTKRAAARYALQQNNEIVPDDLQEMCKRDYNLLVEYEDATFGMHVLHWSDGLRAKLLPGLKELTDDELIEIVVSGKLGVLFESWYFTRIMHKKLDGVILAALQLGDVHGMIELLESKGVNDASGYEIVDRDMEEEKTAFDVKLEKEVRKYSEHIIQEKGRKDANDSLYLNFIKRGHWRDIIDSQVKKEALQVFKKEPGTSPVKKPAAASAYVQAELFHDDSNYT